MSSKSHKDICTQGEKLLCFLMFTNGPIQENELKILKDAKKELAGYKSSLTYKVAWIDAKKHQDWKQKLDIQGDHYPQVKILRTGPRLKYINFDYEGFVPQNFTKMVEKIIGGDARSNMLREGVPDFSTEEL